MKAIMPIFAASVIAVAQLAESRPEAPTPRVVRVEQYRIAVQRIPENPIISYASSATLGTKINGPSLIRVPDWIENPLGAYYLYFAHHDGKYIRLAYADRVRGPWTVYEPGALALHEAPAFIGHIASPDVHVDDASREIRMYFHGSREQENQKTAIAISRDGIRFSASDQIIGSAYFRVFEFGGKYYAIDAHGYLNQSAYPDRGWVRAETELIAPTIIHDQFGKREDLRIRHSATWVREDTLFLFYTRKSDAPERIMLSIVPLQGDWKQWRALDAVEILRPETSYEGIEFPLQPSKKGGGVRKQELRDPCIFHDDGKSYLIYAIAGEMGLAAAEIAIEEID